MFHLPSLLLSITVVAVAAMLLWSVIQRLAADRTRRLNDQRREFMSASREVAGQPVMPAQAAAL